MQLDHQQFRSEIQVYTTFYTYAVALQDLETDLKSVKFTFKLTIGLIQSQLLIPNPAPQSPCAYKCPLVSQKCDVYHLLTSPYMTSELLTWTVYLVQSWEMV